MRGALDFIVLAHIFVFLNLTLKGLTSPYIMTEHNPLLLLRVCINIPKNLERCNLGVKRPCLVIRGCGLCCPKISVKKVAFAYSILAF